MPRLAFDPAQEICPTYEDQQWVFVRQMIINGHQGAQPLTPEDAVQHLKAAWARERNIRAIAWNTQLEQDRAELEEQGRIAQGEQEALRAQLKREAEEQRRGAEKKKPKFNDFDSNRQIASFIMPRPAQYALNKISTLEYVELDYFSLRGCNEAVADTSGSADQDTFSLTQVDGAFTIRPTTHKASRNIRRDEDLSWGEMLQAKNMMLQYIADSKAWTNRHAEALAGFFVALELHPRALQTNGTQALLRYQAKARREWYLALQRNEGFNIESIGEDLLRSLAETVNLEIAEKLAEKRYEEVGNITFSHVELANLYPLRPFPFSLHSQQPVNANHCHTTAMRHPLSHFLHQPPYTRAFSIRCCIHTCAFPIRCCIRRRSC